MDGSQNSVGYYYLYFGVESTEDFTPVDVFSSARRLGFEGMHTVDPNSLGGLGRCFCSYQLICSAVLPKNGEQDRLRIVSDLEKALKAKHITLGLVFSAEEIYDRPREGRGQ